MNRVICGFVVLCALCQPVLGGPIDPYIPSTFRKLLDHTDVVVLAKQLATTPKSEKKPNSVTYSVVRVSKLPRATVSIKRNDQLRLNSVTAGKNGELFLLTGFLEPDKSIDWDVPTRVTEASYKYILETPSRELPEETRLKYFLKFWNHSEAIVVDDAFTEISESSYDVLFSLADHMDADQLRRSFANPKQPHSWRRWQAVMLGVCGNRDDAQLLRNVLDRPRDKRWINGGAMIGLLLLEGTRGLRLLDETRFKNEQASFQDTYAALRAIRCIGTYAPEKIERARLLESMRYLLDRPDFQDMVIADLARWRDWHVQDQLIERFSTKPSFYVKIAIARYMLEAAQESAERKTPREVVVKAWAFLQRLRESDPKRALSAVRGMPIQSEAAARFAFQAHLAVLLPKIDRQYRKQLESTIASNDMLQASRIRQGDALGRVKRYDPARAVLSGKTAELKGGGDCWVVRSAARGKDAGVEGYLDTRDWALLLLLARPKTSTQSQEK